jgi:hypothetical protein
MAFHPPPHIMAWQAETPYRICESEIRNPQSAIRNPTLSLLSPSNLFSSSECGAGKKAFDVRCSMFDV